MGQAQFKKPTIVEMTEEDYRAYFDSSVLRVWHLKGKERTFKIVGVARLESSFKGQDQKQPLVGLVDRRGNGVLPLALNKTNAKVIAGLYGTNPHKWAGKTITLYPTTTDVGSETKECIRVRPTIPGTGVQTKTNRNGVTVIKSAPESVADNDEGAESVREPGDDTADDIFASSEEPPVGALETDHVIR